MSADSDMEDEDMEWLVQEYKKRKRKKNSSPLTDVDIRDIIGTTQASTSKNTSQKRTIPDNTENYKNTHKTTTKNYSLKMKEVINKSYKFMFYINTANDLSRLQMADIWNQEYPNPTDDVILKTKKGFLLKSNTEKYKLLAVLSKLAATKKIANYKETQQSTNPSQGTPTLTFSAIISGVELEIKDSDVSEYLTQQKLTHRYCKRITSRATNKETMLVRIITGCSVTYQNLLNNGLFYKNRHYAIFPSNPPHPCPSHVENVPYLTTPQKIVQPPSNVTNVWEITIQIIVPQLFHPNACLVELKTTKHGPLNVRTDPRNPSRVSQIQQ